MTDVITKIHDVVVPELFAKYSIQQTKEKSALFQSGIISDLPEAQLLNQNGGAAITVPHWNDLDGESEVLSEDKALEAAKITAGYDVAILHARGKMWGANDLAQVLSGDDPLGAIASLTGAYWARQMQKILLSSLKGVFSGTEMTKNQLDITGKSGNAAVISGASFIDAAYRLGDNVEALTAVAMHSATAAALAKQGLIETIRDADGTVLYKTFMDKRVIVDDGMPKDGDTFTTYLFGNGAVGYSEVTHPMPIETDRDSAAGVNYLLNRRLFVLHPRGIRWNGAVGIAPDNAGLETASNWKRVYEPKALRLVAFKHKLSGV